jgi:ATP-binding cassette subfamily B protein
MSTDLKTLRLYWQAETDHLGSLLGSALMAPAWILQNILAPFFVAKALGQLASGHDVSANIIWLAASSYVVGWILYFIGDYVFSAPRAAKIVAELHNKCFNHLLAQDYDFFSNNFSGSLVTQANRFAKGFEMLDGIIFLDVLGPYLGVLIAMGIMIWLSPVIGLIIAVIWILSMILVGYLVTQRMPARRRAVAKESQQTGELADAMTNAAAIKTFASERLEARRFNRTNQARAGLILRSWNLAIRNSFAIQVMCGALQMTVLIGGIYAVTHHAMDIATFLLFQVFILRIIDSINKASLLVRQFEGLLGDAHEMTLLFERQSETQDLGNPKKMQIKNGAVHFDDISFAYEKDQAKSTELFQKLSLDIAAGKRIGLVGPSGGGKTTITRLLLRFHDVQTGRITVDDQDIRDVRQRELREHIAYVPQEPLLFHRTIRENIAYGKPGASDEEIITAAKRAHAHEFVSGLANGYDTLVGERGVKLSGGQRQRIAIARAILKDAPILVLDEATSALDSESEALIQDALWKLMQNRTAIVIAHRLSTVQKMDEIVVLEKGAIVEQGNHAKLLAKKGAYAKLWARQSGGFIEDEE